MEDDHVERSSFSGVQLSPIKVDFGSTAPSSLSVTSENYHKKHVLQQYSVSQQMPRTDANTQNQDLTNDHDSSVDEFSPRSQALQELRRSTSKEVETKEMPESSFTVPTPRLQLAEIWNSEKSVSRISSSHHLKPHDCKVIELDRQTLKVEPHMPPPPLVSSSKMPGSYSSSDVIAEDVDFPAYAYETPVIYNAWTVAKPNASTKHSSLTSARLMQR